MYRSIHGGRRIILALLTWALALACAPPSIRAANGIVHSLPAPTGKKGPLRIDVDTTWVEGRGYRPVQVKITAAKPSQADRTVTIQLRAGSSWNPRGYAIQVDQDIELPAGATTAQATIAVPQFQSWYSISWDVWVDGRYREEISTENIYGFRQGNQPAWHVPTVLAVGDAQQELAALSELVRSLNLPGQQPTTIPGSSAVPAAAPLPDALALVSASSLPTRWIDYSSLDIICLSVHQLNQLVTKNPAAWKAIDQWLRAGGNLWIYGLGDEWERLADVEKSLGGWGRAARNEQRAPSTVPSNGQEAGGSKTRPQPPESQGWTLPTGEEPWVGLGSDGGASGEVFQAPGALGVVQQAPADGPRSESTDDGPSGEGTSETLSDPFRDTVNPGFAWRDAGLGRVMVLCANEPFTNVQRIPADQLLRPSGKQHLAWVMGATGEDRLLWSRRHGLSTDVSSPDFWNLLVPGVGLAPISAFRVLITLFVLLIGPVNYFLLRRWQRLQLLILTVPIGAGIIAASLFVYALFADGLAKRVRVRSYTELDQRHGESVCWARLSYYAGLAPARGLTFPRDTIVLPLMPAQGDGYAYQQVYRSLPRYDVRWTDSQRLARGWLRARTPTQYITVRSHKTQHKLEVRERAGTVLIENQLATPIEALFLQDSAGQFHWGQQIAAGAKMRLNPISPAEVSSKLRSILAARRPKAPPGLYGVTSRSSYINPWGYQMAPSMQPVQATSRLERLLAALDVDPSQAGSPWQAGTYVAIVERSPAVVTGLEDASEEASLHVIRGTW